jgi:DNA-directed RNA polymerase subunit F
MNNDTPRTNDIIEQVKGFRTSSAIYSIEQFSRIIERELTAAREEIDSINAERAEPRGTRKAWIELDDNRQILEKQLKAITEQRDRLLDALERILNYQGRFAEEDPESIATEALQSIATNNER